MTINARALEHAITQMLSHPLPEVRSLGKEIKEISQKALPTLLKYADEQLSLTETAQFFEEKIPSQSTGSRENNKPGAQLIRFDEDLEDQVLRAAIIRYRGYSYAQSSQIVSCLSPDQKKECFGSVFRSLADHDIPIREL
jgi:thymidylate synthase ThyX